MQTKFGFLLFNEFEDLDFFGPWEMIALWSMSYQGPHDVFTITEINHSVKSTKGLSLQPDFTFADCPQLDYLLVPGGQGTRKEVNNTVLTHFIKQQAAHCQHVLSVCTGAFLLQAAGLLQHKKATTHWGSIERLKAFTDVTVVEQRYVRDGNIWTSAGVSAGIDLALAFIAEIAGAKVAGEVQHFAEYYPSTTVYPINGKLPLYVK